MINSASYPLSLKKDDLRDSSGKSESVSENLQKTWRDQEQVAVDKSNTQQRMNSLQQQISYTSQNAASIDSNYNDKVLDETAARHGLSNKAEALAHLNANPNEGKQVLQDLVAQKYGSSMSSQVANKGRGLTGQVDHSLNTNLDTHHKEAKENLKTRYNDISNDENDEMNSKASEVKRAVDDNINTTGETINNSKLDLDSKINSTQEKIKQDQQDTQEKFDRTRSLPARIRDEFKTAKAFHDNPKETTSHALQHVNNKVAKLIKGRKDE